MATSTWPSWVSFSKKIVFRCSASLFSFRCRTKSTIPPLYWKVSCCPEPRSSIRSIFRPRVRNAVSRSRSDSVW